MDSSKEKPRASTIVLKSKIPTAKDFNGNFELKEGDNLMMLDDIKYKLVPAWQSNIQNTSNNIQEIVKQKSFESPEYVYVKAVEELSKPDNQDKVANLIHRLLKKIRAGSYNDLAPEEIGRKIKAALMVYLISFCNTSISKDEAKQNLVNTYDNTNNFFTEYHNKYSPATISAYTTLVNQLYNSVMDTGLHILNKHSYPIGNFQLTQINQQQLQDLNAPILKKVVIKQNVAKPNTPEQLEIIRLEAEKRKKERELKEQEIKQKQSQPETPQEQHWFKELLVMNVNAAISIVRNFGKKS